MIEKEQNIDEKYMAAALDEAAKALENDDVPIGAVIVKNNEIIGRGYNRVEKDSDATSHAEIMAIKDALNKQEYKHLLDCTIYVTLEPCAMCSGAIVLARIPRLVFGAIDPKAGGSGSIFNISTEPRLNHRCKVVSGVLQEECSSILKVFFRELRQRKNK